MVDGLVDAFGRLGLLCIVGGCTVFVQSFSATLSCVMYGMACVSLLCTAGTAAASVVVESIFSCWCDVFTLICVRH